MDDTGRFLAMTKGSAGSMNDNTIIRYDVAIEKHRESPIYAEEVYTLWQGRRAFPARGQLEYR